MFRAHKFCLLLHSSQLFSTILVYSWTVLRIEEEITYELKFESIVCFGLFIMSLFRSKPEIYTIYILKHWKLRNKQAKQIIKSLIQPT